MAATFTVTNTSDSGPGTLRQAILDANGSFGNDDIVFAIPAPGVQTIVLASGLPPILQPLLIDGFTQPGSTINTNPTGQGLNANLQIQIDGTGAVSEPCFQVYAGNDDFLVQAIQGLVINRCPIGAIHIGTGGDGAIVVGNYIGTDPTGTSVPGPQGFGIRVHNTGHVAVGGPFAFERNLISGHTEAGVITDTAPFLGVRGNLIGTNAAGNAAIAPDLYGHGLLLDVAAFAIIGGLESSARNVISGVGNRGVVVSNADASGSVVGNFIGTDVTGTQAIAGGMGIDVIDASPLIRNNVIAAQAGVGIGLERSSSVIQGNFIGTDATGTLALGNSGLGIYALEENGDIVIGGTGAGEGNVIAHNGSPFFFSLIGGIHIRGPKVTIRGNRIFDNFYLGIDIVDGRSACLRDPERSRRRGRRRQRPAELSVDHRRLPDSRRYPDPGVPGQHALDDVRRGSLLRAVVPFSAVGLLAGRAVPGLDPGDHRRRRHRDLLDLRPVRDPTRPGSHGDGDGSRGTHLGVLAAHHPVERAEIGPRRRAGPPSRSRAWTSGRRPWSPSQDCRSPT